MSGVQINSERFFQRLERLQTNIASHKVSVWGNADSICIPMGSSNDALYSKSASMHLYLLGFEFPDSIMVLTKGNFYFMATAKKCDILKTALTGASSSTTLHFLEKTKDEGQNTENFNVIINAIRKSGKKVGTLLKAEFDGSFVPAWSRSLEQSLIETFEIASAIGLFLSIKDESELVRVL